MSHSLRMAAAAAALVCSSFAGAGTLTIESWRVDDKGLWEDVLLPAFYKAHPIGPASHQTPCGRCCACHYRTRAASRRA